MLGGGARRGGGGTLVTGDEEDEANGELAAPPPSTRAKGTLVTTKVLWNRKLARIHNNPPATLESTAATNLFLNLPLFLRTLYFRQIQSVHPPYLALVRLDACRLDVRSDELAVPRPLLLKSERSKLGEVSPLEDVEAVARSEGRRRWSR